MRCLSLLLCLSWAQLAFASPEEEAQKQMEKGVKAFSQKKYSDAVLSYTRALEILPEAAGPHRELGKSFEKLGELDRSIHHYTEYLARRPDAQERTQIEGTIKDLRKKLPTKERAFLTVTAAPGALVYAVADTGESRGIGVSPIEKHPIEPRFVQIRITPQSLPEKEIALKTSQELVLSDADFTAPIKQPEPKEGPTPVNEPTKTTTETPNPTQDEKPKPDIEPKRPSAAYASFTAALVGVGVSGFFAFRLRGVTNQMNEELAALDSTPVDERPARIEEISTLEGEAIAELRRLQAAGALTALSVGAGVFFLVRHNNPKEPGAQLLLSPQGVQVSVSF